MLTNSTVGAPTGTIENALHVCGNSPSMPDAMVYYCGCGINTTPTTRHRLLLPNDATVPIPPLPRPMSRIESPSPPTLVSPGGRCKQTVNYGTSPSASHISASANSFAKRHNLPPRFSPQPPFCCVVPPSVVAKSSRSADVSDEEVSDPLSLHFRGVGTFDSPLLSHMHPASFPSFDKPPFRRATFPSMSTTNTFCTAVPSHRIPSARPSDSGGGGGDSYPL